MTWTVRKGSASRELKVAEAWLKQKALVGTVATGQGDLGYLESRWWDLDSKELRQNGKMCCSERSLGQ